MKWIEPKLTIPNNGMIDGFPNSILLAEQLSARGFQNRLQADRFLNPENYIESSPYDFPQMDRTIKRILSAVEKKEKIGIWGDFDVDGQTSTAVLLKALQTAGTSVSYHIPVRKFESHGIQKKYLTNFVKDEAVDLLITCDTGITEFESIRHAKTIGVDVIISDHHTPGKQLPEAYSIINPKLLPSSHPFYPLAGVGVAYLIIRALIEAGINSIESDCFLDLVALGTIADLAELTLENRFYAQIGLREMNRKTRPAIKAIMKNANFQGGALDESHISFIFAPRLNAAGRLDDANPNVDFLLTEDMGFANQYANELEILNNKRKIAVGNGFHAAENILKKNPGLQNYPILLFGLKNNEPGVVGIVASMLVEKYEKPAILLVKADGLAKGSARSVRGINIIQAITENSSLLLNYGGHPMAAGLALHEKDIPAFREAISRSIADQTEGREIRKELQIDSYLPFSNINDKLIGEISLLSPFGSGNTAPVLVTRNLQIMKRTTFGKTKDHVKISLRDPAGDVRQAIWWKGGVHNPPKSPIDLAYTVRKDSYRNNSGIILEWIDFRETEPESITVAAPKRRIQITDFRLAADQASLLKPLIEEEIQFWSEGIESALSFPTKTRVEIENSRVLGILFPPPGLPTVNKILDKSKPKELLLFNVSAPDDSLKGFLSNLGGYIKNCLTQKKGNGSIWEFAALLGHREGTVIAGLHWFEESGQICLKMANDGFSLTKGPGNRTACLQEKTAILQDLLRETAAFRSFYLRMNPEDLIRIE